MSTINGMFYTLINTPLQDQHYAFFEYLTRILLHQENLKIIKNESIGFMFFLDLLVNFKVKSSQNNLYIQVLSIFERFVSKLSNEEIELMLDLLLNNDNLKKLNQNNDTSYIIDVFSILSIHILLNTNPNLIEKIFSSQYILNLFNFLDCKCHSVRELFLKVILACLATYSKQKKKDNYGKKLNFYNFLNKKLTQNKITQNMCQTMFEFAFWDCNNPNILYPHNTSVVSTLLNRSEQADLIMNLSKSYIDQSRNNSRIIQNLDILEIFFKIVQDLENMEEKEKTANIFRCEMLKIFEAYLDEKQNINLMLENANFLHWFYLLKGKEEIEKEQIMHIIQKIINEDFSKKQCKILDQFKKFMFDDNNEFLFQILKQFFQKLIQNPTLKENFNNQYQQYFLKNFTLLVQNLDELIGVNIQLKILALQCINKLASKNSGQIRLIMKNLSLFDIRDVLVITILQYDIQTDILVNLLEGISFETVANHQLFAEKHTLASIVKFFLESKENFALQMMIIKILKHDVAINEENQKYVTKLFDNNKITQFFYPQQKKKANQSSFAKCLHSNQYNQQNSSSNNEDEEGVNRKQGVSFEEFLNEFYSNTWIDDRKQILLRINICLVPVKIENQNYENKINGKIQSRKQKLIQQFQQEQALVQKKNTEQELDSNTKLIKAAEKNRNFQNKINEGIEKKLSEGEISFLNIHLGDCSQNNTL
ncbi:hypothetical protein IMG5_119330 [Ichthyophthirius multifiliis]|uniref:Armadillo-type fold n=1 Tax=Ichthyophthirius multifiliis TaxID=5932 RepID=G0QUU1_ICHMU|nr:hypothetical protein IMG5_119330 [Ichthyophthirius multifiliis]EGR31021.1 hypothetical protein IMG5_119330 [Ichthyophthirius multifiliis]|eukprot:XP_004034507.1 hypothetical protein IMG5_119330 [Ichthyophthirius multifiliis]